MSGDDRKRVSKVRKMSFVVRFRGMHEVDGEEHGDDGVRMGDEVDDGESDDIVYNRAALRAVEVLKTEEDQSLLREASL